MTVRLTIYPDECDAFGHLNQASWLALFERARWEMLARGPGMGVFESAGVWPAVRRATIDYHSGGWPGDVIGFETELVSRSRTAFTLRQRASRASDGRLCAVLETVFVCIDRDQRPVPVPDAVVSALAEAPQRVEIGEGRSLAWSERGSGPLAVVLVHGFPLDRQLWAAQLEGLTGHRLLAPDLRGTGDSAGEPPRTVAGHADDLAAFLDTLGIRRAVVVGLSMGGYIALDFAARHRDRLAGLVLMDTRATPDSDEGKAGRDKAIAGVRAEGTGALVAGMVPKLFAASTAAATREATTHRMRAVSPEAVIASLEAMRDRPDRTPLLPGLAGIPTLVMVGTEDQLTPPSDARAMVAAIPGAELVEVEGAGHLPPVERPATVNEALQPFLDRVAREV